MKPVVSLAQQSVLSASRMKVWEPIFWLLALASPWIAQQHALIINEIAIVALFAVSLDLVLGYTGIVSLGHAAFLGFGAYSAALFAKWVMPDPLVGLLVGTLAATLLAIATRRASASPASKAAPLARHQSKKPRSEITPYLITSA